MSSDNFCILVLIAVISFMLYMMNKSSLEGFGENDAKTANLAPVNNIDNIKNTNNLSQGLIDKMATTLVNNVNNVNNGNNVNKLPPQPVNPPATAPLDIFKDTQQPYTGVPEPITQKSQGAKPFDNNIDNIQLAGLARDSKQILTTDQLLPLDKDVNEHNLYKINASYMDSNLLLNGMDKLGIDTIGSSRRLASYDIRGNLPCPKFQISPFLNSSYDFDNNLVGLNKTQ